MCGQLTTGRRSPRAPSRVSLAHTRLVSAVEGDPALSPESAVLSLDGTGTEFGTDDESLIDPVDRSEFPRPPLLTAVRAPTRSSLNKQRRNGAKHARRISVIPDGARADERLGLSRAWRCGRC